MGQIAASTTKFRDKLNRLAELSEEDNEALADLLFTAEPIRSNRYLVREGDRPTRCCLLIEGYACREKISRDGARQIVSFQMAGDLLNLQNFLLPTTDHDLRTITDAIVGWIDTTTLMDFVHVHPNVARALAKDEMIDGSIFREWVLNVGRRNAKTRVTHMLCEFIARRQALGIAPEDPFALPFTQQEIGDATGLTSVHVNRMLRALREEGAFEYETRLLRVSDWNRLQTIAGFRPDYLHQAA